MHKKDLNLALITGANSGIGAALARLLSEKGISLILVARDLAKLEKLANELKNSVEVTVVSADLSVQEGCNQVSHVIETKIPDLVVNSAGFGLYGDVLSFGSEESLNMVDLNIKALMRLTIQAAKTLISQKKHGCILNISSASDTLVFPGFAVYAATKAFVTQFSQGLDAEVKNKGVRVLTASPGVVRTNFRIRAGVKKDGGKKRGRNGILGSRFSMDADFAAKKLWGQIVKGKTLNYFDFKTKIMLFIAHHLIPEKLLRKILYKTVLSLRDFRF